MIELAFAPRARGRPSRGLGRAVLVWLASLALLSATGVRAQQQPPQPTLVVLVAVDQLRADYLERFAAQLQGGLGRMLKGGAVFRNAHHDHAITETAPGHAVMLAGRYPRSTGIIRNADGVNDTGFRLVDGPGADAAPTRFEGTTLVDWITGADPRSRALSVSLKDRSAILPIGRSRQHVYWYAGRRFTTSTYYADTLPAWVTAFNARGSQGRYAGAAWTPLLPEAEYAELDSVPLEGGGRDFVFPHPFPADSAAVAAAFQNFPAMDSLIAEFALEGVRVLGLGAGAHTDLLSVGFSTTDVVGHRYGPDSREVHDQLLRLDRYLGAFVDSLYSLRDSSRVIFALTADHGVAPIPEIRAATGQGPARRVDFAAIFNGLRAPLRAAGVPTEAVEFGSLITADREAIRTAGLDPDSLIDAWTATLRGVPGVLRVDRPSDLARADTTRDAVARRWLHMLRADLNAELVVTLEPYAYPGRGANATHGSPHDYDSHVPLIFYGPAFVTGRFDEPARVVDLAPTLAAALGIRPLERLDGRVLARALRRPT